MTTFDITINQTDYSVESGGALEVVFTVTNLKEEPVEGNAHVEWTEGDGNPDWAEIVGGTPMAFAARESRQVTVRISPPADLPAPALEAMNRFQLVMTDLGDQDGARNESVAAGLKVNQGTKKGGFPIWILIAAIVGIGVLVGGGFAVMSMMSGPAETVTTPDSGTAIVAADAAPAAKPNPVDVGCGSDRDCESPRMCHNRVNGRGKCLLPNGERGCKEDLDCISGRCAEGFCQAPLAAMGEACADDNACAGRLTCLNGTCRLQVDQTGCTTDTHCVTDKCENNKCVSNLPGLRQACVGACAEPLTCDNATKKCLYATSKRGCGQDIDCISGFCQRGMCLAIPSLNQPCERLCARDLVCANRACKVAVNKTGCRVTGDCASGYCTGGACRPKPTLNQACTGVCDADLTCESSRCKVAQDRRGCRSNTDCSQGLICTSGVCRLPALNQACAGRCRAGLTCKHMSRTNRVCKVSMNSTGCARNSDCESGVCGARRQCAFPTWPRCQWTAWSSEERSSTNTCPANMAATAMECSGRFCDNIRLQCCPYKPNETALGHAAPFHSRTISEENRHRKGKYNYFSADNGILAGFNCYGKFCDDVRGYLVRPNGLGMTGCHWVNREFSEENRGAGCPKGQFITGLSCKGRFCDNKKIRCCAVPTTMRMP